MGKTLLTPKQSDFLELAQAQATIVRHFSLTGGTALSAFYLKHRLSEDIDLFSEQEIDVTSVRSFLKGISSVLGITQIIEEHFLGLYTYKLRYRDREFLKVDFNYYPFPQIEKGVRYKNLKVSSIYAIAVNKVHTISMKPRARDYVDLYFIFTKSEYTPEVYLERMRIDSQAKFDWPLEVKNLISALLRVKDIREQDVPTMLVPFDRQAMEKFFVVLARSLKPEIFSA